jgi:hypothetical protein
VACDDVNGFTLSNVRPGLWRDLRVEQTAKCLYFLFVHRGW